jgi:galactofuranosylgalactofuranosylrhamnosyl-N-acetylglucosaminyl-diphospho-decaprenol beta-1,5/1,6-galactofuranosyltransferase
MLFSHDLTSPDVKLTDSCLVQEIILPKDKSLTDLYMRMLCGYVEFDENAVYMRKGSKISFNTYFNSFYEDYWSKYTCLEDAELELRFKGSLHVEIFRETARNGCFMIEWKKASCEEMGSTIINLPLRPETGKTGRIFIDIMADTDAEISYMGIRSDTRPQRNPRLTVGLSSAKSEDFLFRNLVKLADLAGPDRGIAGIRVISQEEEFRNPGLKQFITGSALVSCVQQGLPEAGNSAAWAISEEAGSSEADYHILMDGDAQIDSRMIINLSAFISYLNKPMVVGGHVLDLQRPWIYCRAGVLQMEGMHSGPDSDEIDLRGVAALTPFCAASKGDNDAWWFCAVHGGHLSEASCPAPVVVRGKAGSSGGILAGGGIESVTLPGIAVWHEPFFVRSGELKASDDYQMDAQALGKNIPPADKAASREEYLYGILGRLISYSHADRSIFSIIVVNKGAEFERPGLNGLIEKNKIIRYICQSGPAGSSEFTRAMYAEMMKVTGSKYHVFMDDDVQIVIIYSSRRSSRNREIL